MDDIQRMMRESRVSGPILSRAIGRSKIDLDRAKVARIEDATHPVFIRMRPPFEQFTRIVVVDAARLSQP